MMTEVQFLNRFQRQPTGSGPAQSPLRWDCCGIMAKPSWLSHQYPIMIYREASPR